jgi:hypothetical protein
MYLNVPLVMLREVSQQILATLERRSLGLGCGLQATIPSSRVDVPRSSMAALVMRPVACTSLRALHVHDIGKEQQSHHDR